MAGSKRGLPCVGLLLSLAIWGAKGRAQTLQDVAELIRDAQRAAPPPGTASICWRYTEAGTQLYSIPPLPLDSPLELAGASGDSVDTALAALAQRVAAAPAEPPATLLSGGIPTDALWVTPCDPALPTARQTTGDP